MEWNGMIWRIRKKKKKKSKNGIVEMGGANKW